MKYLIVMSLVYLIIHNAGCGQQSQAAVFNIAGFETYYNSFTALGGKHASSLVIKFGTPTIPAAPGYTTAAECVIDSKAPPTITVNKTYWDSANEGYRTELIWHELGHCVLNRLHNNAILPNGKPASIMNWQLFDPNYIAENSEYYMNELVGK